MRPADDAGAIVLGWATKLLVVLSVVGVFGYDLVTVAAAHVGVEDDAQAALQKAIDRYHGLPQRLPLSTIGEAVCGDATAYATAHAEQLSRCEVDASGEITVEVVRPITTLVLHHLPLTRHWASSTTGTATGHDLG